MWSIPCTFQSLSLSRESHWKKIWFQLAMSLGRNRKWLRESASGLSSELASLFGERDSSTFWSLICLIQHQHLCWNTSPRSKCSKNKVLLLWDSAQDTQQSTLCSLQSEPTLVISSKEPGVNCTVSADNSPDLSAWVKFCLSHKLKPLSEEPELALGGKE